MTLKNAFEDLATEETLSDLLDLQTPLGDFDPGNSWLTQLAANETKLGDWAEFGAHPGQLLFLGYNQLLTTVQIQWSNDGITHDTSALGTTPVLIQAPATAGGLYLATYILNTPVNKFYRVRIVNGPTATTSGFVRMWRLRDAFHGSFTTVDTTPTGFSVALLTRAIIAGRRPDGTFTNKAAQGVSSKNSSIVPLGADETFTGVAENISDFAEETINVYAEPANAIATMYFEFSPNGTDWDVSIPADIEDPTLVVPVPLRTVLPFFRVRYVNGAVPQTAFRLTTFLHDGSAKTITRFLDQQITDQEPVEIVRSVVTGRDPDGDFQNAVQAGTKTLSPATGLLGGGAAYESEWMDCESYPSIRLLVASDVPAADNGVIFQWSDTPTGVVIQTSDARDFRSGNTATGRLYLTSTRARYLRIRYLNGATIQTRFFLNLRMSPDLLADTIRISSLEDFRTGQVVLGTGSAQIAATPLSGRKTIRIKNSTNSTRDVYFGATSAVAASGGPGVGGDELAEGEAIEFDADETVQVWVIKASGGAATITYSEFA